VFTESGALVASFAQESIVRSMGDDAGGARTAM
jgi:acyl-CoA thioesterase